VALSVPTTQTVSDNIIAAVEASIGKSIPLLPKSFTRVLSKALAGVFILTYKYGAWSLLQQFVEHASFRETEVNGRKFTPLIEWGRLVGAGDPVIATNAEFEVTFDVLNEDSSTVPAGKQLVHPSSGIIYITLAAVVLDDSPKLVDVLAASDPDGNGGSGVQGNRAEGDTLKWANPIPQLSTLGGTVTATAPAVTAADAETEAAYRARVVDRFQARPQGGAYADYRIWGTEEVGIINIYPYTGSVPGQVDVYVEATVASSGDADGIPTAAQIGAVEALIEYDSSGIALRRPVSAYVNVVEITRQPFGVTVYGLAADDEPATKATIEASVDDWFRSREPFIVGLSVLPRQDRVTVSAVSGVVDEAVSAEGATVTSVEVTLSGSPIIAYTLDLGQKAKSDGVDYVT
jgi:uncharacterized phage protein gp47/JayE